MTTDVARLQPFRSTLTGAPQSTDVVGPTLEWQGLDRARDVADRLATNDGRANCLSLWHAVTGSLLTTLGETARIAGAYAGRTAPVRIDAGAAVQRLLDEPAAGFAARFGPSIVATADGWLAAQVPTTQHEEYFNLCIGCGPGDNSLATFAAWATARPSLEAAEELQLWRIPAAAAAPRTWPANSARAGRPVAAASRQAIFPGDFRPMRGIRVVELGGLWAGPLATHLLGELGAEVTKVEAPTRPDGLRRSGSPLFHELNHGKDFVALDLRIDADRARFCDMAGDALLVENMSARVLPNLGLDASYLAETCSTRVVSLRAFRGRSDWVGLGSVIEFAAGLTLPGVGGAPSVAGFPFTDALAGVHGALVAVASCLTTPAHVVVGQVEDVAARVAPPPAITTEHGAVHD